MTSTGNSNRPIQVLRIQRSEEDEYTHTHTLPNGNIHRPGIRGMQSTKKHMLSLNLDKRARIYRRWIILVLHRDRYPSLFPSLSFLSDPSRRAMIQGWAVRLFHFPFYRQEDRTVETWPPIWWGSEVANQIHKKRLCIFDTLARCDIALIGVLACLGIGRKQIQRPSPRLIARQRRTHSRLACLLSAFPFCVKSTATHTHMSQPFWDCHFHCS